MIDVVCTVHLNHLNFPPLACPRSLQNSGRVGGLGDLSLSSPLTTEEEGRLPFPKKLNLHWFLLTLSFVMMQNLLFPKKLPFPKKLNLRWFLLTLSFIEGIWLTINMVFSTLDAEEMLHNAVMRLDFYRSGTDDRNLTPLFIATLAIMTRGWVLMATVGFAYAVFKRGHGYDKWVDIYQVMNALTIICALTTWIVLAIKPAMIGQYFLQNNMVQVLDVMFDFIVPVPICTTSTVLIFQQMMQQEH